MSPPDPRRCAIIRSTILAGTIALTTVATVAEAAVEPVSQFRRAIVFATASVGEEFSHDSIISDATDFGLFDDTIEIVQSVPGTSAMADALHRSYTGDVSFFCLADFSASATAEVGGAISIFDAAGRLVRTLDASSTRAIWDGRGRAGERVAPSVYSTDRTDPRRRTNASWSFRRM